MWTVSWSWQSNDRISSIHCVGTGVLVSHGLKLTSFSNGGEILWEIDVPFKIHSINSSGDCVVILAAHAFYLLDLESGSYVMDGKATHKGFRGVIPRPGGGWVLSGRSGNIHIFSEKGVGIRRIGLGIVRKLVGWLDRDHLVVHKDDGKVAVLSLGRNDRIRDISEQTWSWVSDMFDGKILLQGVNGGLCQALPNLKSWDSIESLERGEIEPMQAVLLEDGWWVLHIDGAMYNISSDLEESKVIGLGMDLGDLLDSASIDVCVSANKNGLVRHWLSESLARKLVDIRHSEATEMEKQRVWESRREIFQSAKNLEESGDFSSAKRLYEQLGRESDVDRMNRMLRDLVD